jgi:hypothetical protein
MPEVLESKINTKKKDLALKVKKILKTAGRRILRGLDDHGGGAVVALEAHAQRAGECGAEEREVFVVGAIEAVDRLVVVPDLCAHVSGGCTKGTAQIRGRCIGASI